MKEATRANGTPSVQGGVTVPNEKDFLAKKYGYLMIMFHKGVGLLGKGVV